MAPAVGHPMGAAGIGMRACWENFLSRSLFAKRAVQFLSFKGNSLLWRSNLGGRSRLLQPGCSLSG